MLRTTTTRLGQRLSNRTQETAMRISSFTSTAMILMVTSPFAVACGSGNDTTGVDPGYSSLTANVEFADICEENEAPDLCDDTLEIPVVFNQGRNDRGGMEVHRGTLVIDRDSETNSGSATIEIPSSVVKANSVITAYLDTSDLLPQEFDLQRDGGGDASNGIVLVGGTEVDLRIVQRALTDDDMEALGAGSGLGNACFSFTATATDGEPSGCFVTIGGQDYSGTAVPDGVSCSGLYVEGIEATTHTVTATCDGDLTGTQVVGVPEDGTIPVTIPVTPTNTQSPGYEGVGNACATIENADGEAVPGCSLTVDGHVTAAVSLDGCSGSGLADLEATTHTFGASCDGGLTDEVVVEVVEGGMTPVRLVVRGPATVSTTPATTDACVVVSEGGTVRNDCTVTMNGQEITGDEDTGRVCPNGLFVDDVPALVYTFAADCGDDVEGAIVQGFGPDMNNVIIPVSDTGGSTTTPAQDTEGGACITVVQLPDNSRLTDATDCNWRFVELGATLTPDAAPPATCEDDGEYYFDDLPATADGVRYTAVLDCPSSDGSTQFTVVAGYDTSTSLTLVPDAAAGEPCLGVRNFTLDRDTLSVDAKPWMGEGTGDYCNLSAYEDFADWTVTGILDPSGDECGAACPIEYAGNLVFTTTVADIDSVFADGEHGVYTVQAENGDGDPLDLPIDVLNGNFQ